MTRKKGRKAIRPIIDLGMVKNLTDLPEIDIVIRLKKRVLEMLVAVAKMKNMDHKGMAYEMMEVRIVEEYSRMEKVKRFLEEKVE